MAIVLVVVIVAAGASAVVLLQRGGPARNATATVRLHDAEIINISDHENRINDLVHSMVSPDASIDISGTLTINSFSATNVTVKLHNKTADEWITVVEGQNITDMTTANEFSTAISAGTYDKVLVYIGTVTLDVSGTEITVNFINFPEGMAPTPPTGTLPAGGYSGSVDINVEFEISFATEVVVAEGENQVFDVDTGPPIDPVALFLYVMGEHPGGEGDPIENAITMDEANMSAQGL